MLSLCRTTGIPYQKSSLSCAENESQIILAKNLITRSKLTASNVLERNEKKCFQKVSTESRNQRWKAKTRNSPYAVDLLADYSEMGEGEKPRSSYPNAETMMITDRREKAQDTSIVRVAHTLFDCCRCDMIFCLMLPFNSSLKISDESSYLDSLRREKRAILKEEQRLKALLNMEKSNDCDKESRLIAEKALRQRQQAKLQCRRLLYQNSLHAVTEEESFARRRKCGM